MEDDITELLGQISEETGLSVSTVCNRALGNSNFEKVIENRRKKMQVYKNRLIAWRKGRALDARGAKGAS